MLKGKQIAAALSYVLSPISTAFMALLILGLFPLVSPSIPLFHFIIAFFFLCIFPMIAMLYNHNKGKVDIWVSNKTQRTPFYIIAIIGYMLASFVFSIQQDPVLYVLTLSYLFVTLTLTITNLITKVSSHSAGVTGPVTALSYTYGVSGAFLFLLLIPVIWARLKLNAHTLFQLLFGILISFIVTSVIYLFFYQ